MKFDLDDAPYLQTADGGGFCQPGQLVTAKKNSDGSCSYTVPAGGVETMTQTFYLKAKDTEAWSSRVRFRKSSSPAKVERQPRIVRMS